MLGSGDLSGTASIAKWERCHGAEDPAGLRGTGPLRQRDPRAGDGPAAAPARRDRAAAVGRHADLGRSGRVPGVPGEADRRPARARGRHLHRLQRALHRLGAAGGRRAGGLRRQRGVDRDRKALLAGGGPRRAHQLAPGAGKGDPGGADRGGGRHLRLRLHRRRQGELRRLLRGRAHAAPAGRADGARQHAARWRLGRGRARLHGSCRPAGQPRRFATTRGSMPARRRSAPA